MNRKWASKILLVVLLAGLLSWAGVEGYRAYVDRWEGSLRAPLIAASAFGILFIIVGTTIVTLQDRARERTHPGR